MGQRLELGLARAAVRPGQTGDADRGIAHERERVGFAEDAQRADDLLQRLVQLQQGVAPGGVAEEVVEGLFDVAEAGQQLLGQLLEQRLVLPRAAGAEDIVGRACKRHLAALQGLQALQHRVRAGSEAGRRRAALEAALEQQQRGGAFHRGGVRALQRVAPQPMCKVENARDQALGGGALERGGRSFHRRDRILEVRERDRGAGAELVPVFARAGQVSAQGVEQRRGGRAADAGAGLGQQGVELPAFAHGALLGGVCRAVRDLEQQFAQQAVGGGGRAGEHAAELGVELGAQALDAGRRRQAAVDQGVVEGEARPPQAARRGVVLLRLDLGDGLAHGTRAVAGRALAQPVEQAALEAAARAAQDLGGGIRVGRGGALGAGRGATGEVGVEQVRRAGVGLAAGGGERQVGLGQAQGLVGRAVGELFEVVADHRQRPPRQRAPRGIGRHGLARHVAEQLLERIGKLGQAVEADDGQCAAHLMQVGVDELQARRVGVGRAPVEDLAGAAQCGVDLALDPGQRSQVRRGGVCHADRSRTRSFTP